MLTRSAAKKAEVDRVNPTRDAVAAEGTRLVITPSATGKGVHTRWIRTTIERSDTQNIVDENSTSSFGSQSTEEVDPRFVTPNPQESYEPVSALRTPRKLPRSPGIEKVTPMQQRMRGIPKQLVFEDGSLSEESLTEKHARDEITAKQFQKLMDEKKENDRLLSKGKGVESKWHGDLGSPFGSSSGVGASHAQFVLQSPIQNQIVVDQPRQQQLPTPPHQPYIPHRLGPNGTHLTLDYEDEPAPVLGVAPRLGPHGTHLLGPHGTELLQFGLGPHGTELI